MSRRWKWVSGWLLLAAGWLLLDSLLLHKYFFTVRRINIGKKKASAHLNIILVSDLHMRYSIWRFHRKLAATINELNPHLLLIAGDIVDQFGYSSTAAEMLALIDKSIVKIAIPGNHDLKNKRGVTRQHLKQILSGNNGHLLVNETIELEVGGIPIAITGLDDDIEGDGRFKEAVQHIGYKPHHLAMVHSPKQHEDIVKGMKEQNASRPAGEQLNISYIFAGHNHGGQVRIGSYAPVLPEASGNYLEGWYNDEKPFLYLSKGFGTSGIPFRFGARSEIIVFNYGA